MKAKVQSFGKFLSGMVMPNIGAFIAWGFLTALFIATGWLPNERLSSIVDPMLKWLLPVMIAGQGGFMVAGNRGRVIAMIAVTGCIMGADAPMLMGAMLMGPLAGWIIKKFDEAMEGHMPAGFEMLINNFSIGLIGLALIIAGFYLIGPLMSVILAVLKAGVDVLVSHSLLPLVAIFIEPAKVLFLNNAINHGIFSPIGIEQVAEAGRSIMFMLEANPGPGLGVLLAYALFCKDSTTRQSAPGAIIIHFFGGIHEIYFPYILMNPVVIIAPIVGNICAIAFFSMFKCGLTAPASPGSIIAFMSMAPRDSMVMVFLGVVIATAVSFLIAAPIVKMSGTKNLEDAQKEVAARKAESKGQAPAAVEVKSASGVKKVIFACDAGMGSSAMGATKFRNRIKAQRPDISVTNTSVDTIPADCDIAVVQQTLVARAQKSAPNAQIITIGNFLTDPNLDKLYDMLTAAPAEAAPVAAAAAPAVSGKPSVIVADGVLLGQKPVDKETAIRTAGNLLVKLGNVEPAYVDAMVEREKLTTTYMGMGVAIPHGTSQAKGTVKKTGIVMVQYPDGVDFGDEKAQLVFGIAGIGDEHLDLLGKIGEMLEDEDIMEQLKTTKDVSWVLSKLQ